MWKAALAGALLATVATTFVSAQDFDAYSHYSNSAGETTRSAQQRVVVTDGQIARLRAALRLTSEQLRYWPAVESALRSLSRRAHADRSSDGMIRRAAASAVDANAVRRVVSAAGPLISVLDEKQKQAGMRVVRSLGFGHLASSF